MTREKTGGGASQQEISQNTREIFSEIILDIYRAPIYDLFVNCSRELKRIIPCSHTFTNLNDQANKFRQIFNYRSEDTDAETLALYANYYHELDYISWEYKQCGEKVFRATDVVSEETIERSRIHKEWHSRMDVFYTATACVASDDILYGTISLMRSKEQGDFTDREMLMFADVNKHLCNRFKLAYPHGVNRLMMDVRVDPIAARFQFTPREWEITCLFMQGYSRVSIAEELCISINTIKKHVANIYQKMGVNNTQQFFAELARIGTTLEHPQGAE